MASGKRQEGESYVDYRDRMDRAQGGIDSLAQGHYIHVSTTQKPRKGKGLTAYRTPAGIDNAPHYLTKRIK